MDMFLDPPQDLGSFCPISRTFEVLGIPCCCMHDPNNLVRRRYGKGRTRQIKAISRPGVLPGALLRVTRVI